MSSMGDTEVPPPSNASKSRKRMKNRSPIWEHFTRHETSEGVRASCNYCKIKYNCDTKKNGTSTLWAHLSKCLSRSTMKRRCEEFKLDEWLSRGNKKNSNSKTRKANTKSPSGSDFPHPTLVEHTNLESTEHAIECLYMLNQHNLLEEVAPVSDVIDNSTPTATTESVRELTVACHTDGHESVRNVHDSTSSSSFDIKATYKEDVVRFKWSSIACLGELKKAMVENLNINFDSFKMKYQDEEEDWVLINTEEHMKRAYSLIKNNILRLKVSDS